VTRKITEEQRQRYQEWFDNARRLHRLVSELEALPIEAIGKAEGWKV
jgi:predicted nucleic acid-binding OB-fold protein